MTQIERHQETGLAYRGSCGVAVSLLWNPKKGDVSALVDDSGLREHFVVPAAREQALHNHTRAHEDRVLRAELALQLGREPISGRLRPEPGAEEPFVGWLGFVDALTRLNERKEQK